jgi:ribosomal RNA-processing protein 7
MAKDKSKTGKSSKSSASSKLQEFSGFKVLPVHMNRGAIHYLYMKKHESRVDSATTPKDRTLFLLNLPTDTTEAHLKKLFKPYARIINVKYHSRGEQQAADDDEEEDTNAEEEQEDQQVLTKRQKKMKNAEETKRKENDPSNKIRHLLTTGSYAHVIVLDTKELDNLLNMGAKKRDWNTEDEATLPLGFDRKCYAKNIFKVTLAKH